MLRGVIEREQVRKYLKDTLKMLHVEFKKSEDVIDAASIQGAILQAELSWSALLGEDAPGEKELTRDCN